VRFLLGQKPQPRKRRKWLFILIGLILIITFAGWYAQKWYNDNLAQVTYGSALIVKEFTVNGGESVDQITANLHQAKLIRNERAFKLYLRLRHESGKLQAGTYILTSTMSAPRVATALVNGYVSKDYVTILPGKTIAQIKQTFKQVGYSDSEINTAFNPATYAGHPLLANLPPGGTLEGLLYPDTFQKEAGTSATTIVKESLDEMESSLSSDIISGFAAQGLSIYQGLTLASIVYKESGTPAYESTVAT
jgi:UPF0755 protein